jgi:hypothetical protein
MNSFKLFNRVLQDASENTLKTLADFSNFGLTGPTGPSGAYESLTSEGTTARTTLIARGCTVTVS